MTSRCSVPLFASWSAAVFLPGAPLENSSADFKPSSDIKDTPLDIEVLRSAAAEVKDQLPILQTAQVGEFRGGIPTMTADGHHVLGPAPGVEGFYFASGCNVAGLSISPTVGEALATWIVDGKCRL